MSVSIKICGLNSVESVDSALASGADLVGFVFFPPSPRHIGPKLARTLGARVMGRAAKVALTVDAEDDALIEIISTLEPDLLQLHGNETPERVLLLRERFRLPVIKALPIADRSDLLTVPMFAKVADLLLFDARAPKEATRPGGLGEVFDWRLLSHVEPGIPYMLSGGLNVHNVAEALEITNASGVDVSSGVETLPGRKDPDKIKSFIEIARSAAVRRESRKVVRI
jgi:phosphoribosylanthranilate isomerase